MSVTGSDGEKSFTRTIEIVVANTNQTPVIPAIPLQLVQENETLSFTLMARAITWTRTGKSPASNSLMETPGSSPTPAWWRSPASRTSASTFNATVPGASCAFSYLLPVCGPKGRIRICLLIANQVLTRMESLALF
jgi:hypothetical protein